MAVKFNLISTLLAWLIFANGALAVTDTYVHVRYAHGIIAATAWVIIFPLGGIIIRLLNNPYTLWIHAGLQIFGYLCFCYVFAAGIYMSYINEYYIDPHIEIGIILFGLTTMQMILGFTHHVNFKATGRRAYVTFLHVCNGRFLIPVAMVNGGLGLLLSAGYPQGRVPIRRHFIAYGLVAGLVYIAYLLSVPLGEARKERKRHEEMESAGLLEKQGNGVEARKVGVYE